MAAPSISDLFTGEVVQREYSSPLLIEWIVMARAVVISHTVEQTFAFEGLTYAQAHTTMPQFVTDVVGNTYTVPFQSSFTDGSKGYAIYPQEQVDVQRDRMSPHMWRVTVTRRGSKLVRLYSDGSSDKIFDAPTWAASLLP